MIGNSKFHDAVRRTAPSAAMAAGIILALCVPSQSGAQGGFTGPGQYEIVNVNSGKVLELNQNDQTSVLQFPSQGGNNQGWDIRSAGSGYYYLQNTMNGNALEAAGNNNSKPVRASRFTGKPNQQWRFETVSNGNALIVSRLGKTLDIRAASTEAGAVVQTFESNGTTAQQFTFRDASGHRSGGSSGAVSSRTVIPISSAGVSGAGRTQLDPGWNMYSPQQDVDVGEQASNEVAKQVLMLNNSRVDNYLNNLGQRLSAQAPGFNFPYVYKAVNDRGINAFALPGGHIYVNRGVIEAADNESQLAGVMAHETAHVALRHGTNQASKASIAQMPLAMLGGLLGSDSTGAMLTQLGAGFTVNSIFLKYSRDAERQADLMGTQILYDAGYDPRGMSQFFAKIQGENGIAFFSSHPNPDGRIENVNEEVARLGPQRNSQISSREFDQIKRYVQSLPTPRPNQLQSQQQQATPAGQPVQASDRFVTIENSLLRINRPEDWKAYGQGDAMTIAPDGGLVNDGNGNQALAYGVIVNIYEPQADRYGYGQQLQGPGYGQAVGMTAEQATDQLVATLQQSNRNMRVVHRQGSIDVNGERGLSTYLSNDSPMQAGGRETNWLVTLPRPEGLLFFVFTAPERDFQRFENTFQQMLYSVRIAR